MRIKGFFYILVFLLLALGSVLLFLSSQLDTIFFYIGEGLILFILIYLTFFYRKIVKPLNTIGSGMELLREQDFSSRLSPVGQYEAGYTHATHFYNAMPGFHKRREYKYEGTVESIYLIDDMTVEVVADGIHVPPTILRLVYKIKGVERTCLITDALACAASDSQVAFDPRVIIEDGVCKLADHSALAGSVATMDRLIRTMVQKAEIPLEDAVRMASETPARIMGVLDRKGTLERGKDADMIALDRDLNVRAVWAMGELVEGTNKLF